VRWSEFRGTVLDGSRDVSPWCVEQVEALPEDPVHAPGVGDEALPPAARP
jgi:isopentenyl-diphosphate delta-isomerase